MKLWELSDMRAEPSSPAVLASHPEGRAVALELPAGEELGDHEVHERAWLVVARGRVELETSDGRRPAGVGSIAVFDPGERHVVRAVEDSRLLLLLTPWPAEERVEREGIEPGR